MPRVGSSTISTFGPSASHLASTTFCWLPPLKRRRLDLDRWRLDLQLAADRAPRPGAPRVSETSRGARSGRAPGATRSRESRSPRRARLTGDPRARERSRGGWRLRARRSCSGCPPRLIGSGDRRLDAEDRLRDFRPAGADQTGHPEDLAAADGERHGVLRISPGSQPVDAEVVAARRSRARPRRARRSMSRPTISRIMLSCVSSSCASAPAFAPSRRTTARSAIACTSPSRCVM